MILVKNNEKIYRTRIKIVGGRNSWFDCIIPGWNPRTVVSFHKNDLPQDILSDLINWNFDDGDFRFDAFVNLDAIKALDLFLVPEDQIELGMSG